MTRQNDACQSRHELGISLRSSPNPDPMTEIRFDSGIIVTIRDGFVEAPSPAMTALIDALAATLPPFAADADIARGIIERIGLGKIVRRDASNLALRTAERTR